MSRWRGGLRPTPDMPVSKRVLRAGISGLVLFAVALRMTGSILPAVLIGGAFAVIFFGLDSIRPRDPD